EDVTVAVLVLQTFARKRGSASGAAEQKAARAHVSSGPDEVGYALETEHRVVNEKRNRVDAVRCVRSARGNERGHGTGFGDSFFEDLAVLGFLVIQKSVYVDRLITLAGTGINADGAEERFHAKGARFIGNDRDDKLADFGIAEHFAKHPHVG